jgi:hypothetical protein
MFRRPDIFPDPPGGSRFWFLMGGSLHAERLGTNYLVGTRPVAVPAAEANAV